MANSVCIALLSLLALVSIVAGTQFRVGGNGQWAVPDANATSYNQWAQKNRFKIGDSLAFTYLPDADSVLLVDVDAYNACKTSSHIDEFADGNTVFTFTRSGAFHFISGVKENCEKNEKLVVVVLADRSSTGAPAPAPLATQASPPPPPAEGGAEGPTAPPPPPNAASSTAVGMISTLGAVIGAFSYVF